LTIYIWEPPHILLLPLFLLDLRFFFSFFCSFLQRALFWHFNQCSPPSLFPFLAVFKACKWHCFVPPTKTLTQMPPPWGLFALPVFSPPLAFQGGKVLHVRCVSPISCCCPDRVLSALKHCIPLFFLKTSTPSRPRELALSLFFHSTRDRSDSLFFFQMVFINKPVTLLRNCLASSPFFFKCF